MKYKLITILAICSSYVVVAQQTKTLTLKEAVDLSIANSKQLKLNEAKLNAAIVATKEAQEKQLPDASLSGSYLYLPIKPNVSLKLGQGAGAPNVSQVIYGSLGASLPLYNGGKLKYGIESAKYLEQAVKLDGETDRNTVTLNTISACINLFKAKEAITLFTDELAQSKQRIKDLTNLEKNGVVARNDLMKAELQSSNIELSLLDAQSNYKMACINMDIMIGWPEETEIIADKTGLSLPPDIKTFNEYEQAALQNRNEINAIAMRKKIADVDIKTIKAEAYPSLALTGGYIAADIPNFFSVTNAVNIGVGVKYNIGSLWKNKTKIQFAQAGVKQIQINEDILNDNIRMQVNQTYQNYLVSRKEIEVYQNAVLQATENYRITNNKYNNTLATLTELLDADVAKLQANLSVTNAQADSYLAYSKLLYATGLLKY